MSEKMTIGRPYAKAIYLLASQMKNYMLWSDLLFFLCKFINDESIIKLINNPMVSIDRKSDFIISFFDNKLEINQINFINLLSKNNRLLYINEISFLYHAYVDNEQNIVKLEVVSASGINKEGRDRLTHDLSKKFDKKVIVEFSIDAKLLGGVIIKFKDNVIDGTLRESLVSLKKLLIF